MNGIKITMSNKSEININLGYMLILVSVGRVYQGFVSVSAIIILDWVKKNANVACYILGYL